MKYTTLQITRETRNQLQEYCKENGYTMSGLVEKLIRKEINTNKVKIDPSKVLKSAPRMVSTKYL